VLDEGGQLDRGRLRRVVFSDPEQRARLEAILHPRIRTAMAEELARIHAPYCIVCIPLLVESAQKDLVHRVLVVDAPEALQYARIRDRDELSNDDISAIMSAQATRGQRLAAADDIIVNDGDLESLQEEVARLHRFYCEQTGQPLSH
jgi:dephospho-CoA kinase